MQGEKQQYRREIYNTIDLLRKLLGESDKRVNERGSKERLTFEALLRCVRDLTVAFFRTQLFPRRKQSTACAFVVKHFFQKNYFRHYVETISAEGAELDLLHRNEPGSLFRSPRATRHGPAASLEVRPGSHGWSEI